MQLLSPIWHTNSNSFTRTSTAKQKEFAQKLLPPAGISGLPCRVCASSQRPTAFLLFTATYTQNCPGAHGELTCYDVALLKRQNETTQQVSFLQQTAQSYHYISIDQLCLDLVLLHSNNHHELLSVLWLLAQGRATTAQTIHNTSVRHIWLRVGSLGEDLNLERRTTLSRRLPQNINMETVQTMSASNCTNLLFRQISRSLFSKGSWI